MAINIAYVTPTVKSCKCRTAHIGEQKAVRNQWTGLLNWNTEMS